MGQRIFIVPHRRLSLREVRARSQIGWEPKQRQEVMQILWSCCLLTFSVCFLIPGHHLHRSSSTHIWLGTPSILNKKLHQRPAHKPMWWEHFLKWSSLFKNDSKTSQHIDTVGRLLNDKEKKYLTIKYKAGLLLH